jgi:hypothetical protein
MRTTKDMEREPIADGISVLLLDDDDDDGGNDVLKWAIYNTYVRSHHILFSITFWRPDMSPVSPRSAPKPSPLMISSVLSVRSLHIRAQTNGTSPPSLAAIDIRLGMVGTTSYRCAMPNPRGVPQLP